MSGTLSNVKVSRDESAWEIDIKAEIPSAALAKYREETLKDLQKSAKLDGFRPGHAPKERLVEVYGESAILKMAAEHALQHELPELLATEKVMIVESPRVTMETPEAGKAVVFSARAALVPEVKLPNYKKIAASHNAKKEEVTVSDKEHTEAMAHLRRERARIDKIEAGTDQQKAHEESRAMKDEELPALDDAFVQSLGYESAEKFAEALKGNIKSEKEMRVRETRRAAILDELVKESDIKYPAALREYELDDMEARIKDDITRAGMTWEGYLTEAKKTAEEVRASWKDAADKRAKVRLILAEIARKENIEPDPKALDSELEHAKKHYKDADQAALRSHIAHIMRNEAAIKFLESLN